MENQKDAKLLKSNMEELSPVLCELLRSGQKVRLTVTGNSMYPMLHDRRDSVVLAAPRTLKRLDLPLYRRENGSYILHRVMRVKKGVYTMCGDNQTVLETPIFQDQIVAVAVEFSRNGKTISCSQWQYRFYAGLWGLLRPLRPVVIKGYLAIRKKWNQKRRGNS